MFEFKKNGIHVVKYRILWLCLSALLLIPGIVAMIYSMITYPTHSPVKVGIDYTGGTLLQYGTSENVSNQDVGITRENLAKDGITNAYIQVLKVNNNEKKDNTKSMISVRTKFIDEGSPETEKITNIMQSQYKDAQLIQVSSVGPTLSNELFKMSFIALLVAILGMVCYISFRFEFKYAVSAMLGILHDVLFVLGAFSLLGLFYNVEVDGLFLTAMLTVIGYSVNDTIVTYDRIRENADLMAADYEKIYELSKINRNINKTLDDTKIIAGKQKLKSLQKEINDLQNSGVELSKYDLEYLQAKYELRLAEIELENAQNAKSTVRLSKDNEGNWSYIYTQNAEDVEESYQKYEDALYKMQQLSQEYLEEMSSTMLDTSSAMMEEISNLRIQDFNSYEEYQKEIKHIQDKYAESLRLQENELNKAVSNSQQIYEQDWRNYNLITGYKISDSEKWADAFRESTIGQLLNSDSIVSSFSDTILGLTHILTKNLCYFIQIELSIILLLIMLVILRKLYLFLYWIGVNLQTFGILRKNLIH